MKQKVIKSTYLMVAAISVFSLALYAGCSNDEEEYEDTQKMSLATRRLTRSAESGGPQKPTYREPENKGDSIVVYESFDTTEIRHYGTLDYSVSVTSTGGLANTVKVSSGVGLVAVPENCTGARIYVEEAFYHNGGAMVYYVLKFRQFGQDVRYDGEYFHPLPYHYEAISQK